MASAQNRSYPAGSGVEGGGRTEQPYKKNNLKIRRKIVQDFQTFLFICFFMCFFYNKELLCGNFPPGCSLIREFVCCAIGGIADSCIFDLEMSLITFISSPLTLFISFHSFLPPILTHSLHRNKQHFHPMVDSFVWSFLKGWMRRSHFLSIHFLLLSCCFLCLIIT